MTRWQLAGALAAGLAAWALLIGAALVAATLPELALTILVAVGLALIVAGLRIMLRP
jgi:hypothetical protein